MPSAEPTEMPSAEATHNPSQAPTMYVTQDPTTAPSQSPTLPNKYEHEPRPNAITAEDAETESTTRSPQRTGPQVYDLATLVVTYTLDPVDGDRNNRRRLTDTNNNNNNNHDKRQQDMSESTTKDQHYYVNTDYMINHHQATQRQRRNLLTFNRKILESVTAKHVRRELRRQLGFWLEQQQYQQPQPRQNDNEEEQEQHPLQVSVDLTMTSIRAFLLPNETVVATEAISGYVSVDGPPSVQWPGSIKENIEQAFEDRALQRYTELLEESDDKALQHMKSIETGLPLDLLSSDGDGSKPANSNSNNKDAAALTNTPSNQDNQEEEGWTIAGFTISLTLLAIIAGSVALLSVALLICVWWRMRVFRKQAYDSNNAPQVEDEEQPVEGEGRSRKSKRSQKTQKIKNNANNNDNSNKNVKQPSGGDTSPTNSDIDPATDPTMQKYFNRYVNDVYDDDNRSVATSTYSYIDTNLQHINANVSLAPSFLYGNDDIRWVYVYISGWRVFLWVVCLFVSVRLFDIKSYLWLQLYSFWLTYPRTLVTYYYVPNSLQSKTMWSLIDGITNDENYNYHDTASPAQLRNIDTEEEANLQTPDRLIKSPSNMLISTAPKNFDADLNDDLYDDDDQLSLASYGYTSKRPSPDPIPMPEPMTTPKQPSALEKEQQQQQSSRTIEDVAATPNSQINTDTFTDNNSESQDSNDVKHLARQGVSARKKKNTTRASTSIGSTATSNSVRKALGQLAACATSHKDKEDHGEDPDITPAPSDEKSSPSSDVENQQDNRRSLLSSASSRAGGGTSALREVNQRLSGVDSSVEGSKNSSLYPGKLFNDTTLKSESSYMVEQPKTNATTTNSSALDTSALMKDANGNYVIDSMASF